MVKVSVVWSSRWIELDGEPLLNPNRVVPTVRSTGRLVGGSPASPLKINVKPEFAYNTAALATVGETNGATRQEQ